MQLVMRTQQMLREMGMDEIALEVEQQQGKKK